MKSRIGILSAAVFACLSASLWGEPYRDGDTVVFFGDSITHGGRYHVYISDYYNTRFPEAKIRFVNSGIGGDTAAGAYSRIDVDVREYDPTHVAFHFGMNDIGRGNYLPDATSASLRNRAGAMDGYRENLKKLVDGVRAAAPRARFAYLTPTPYDDTAVVTNGPASGWASYNNVGCNVGLSLMAGHVLSCAARDKADAVDWYSVLNNFMRRHQAENPHFSFVAPDRVHPGELGHSVMAWEFLKRQGVPPLVSAVEIADGALVRAENAKVTDLRKTAGGVAFTLDAAALPMPVHEKALPYVGEFDVEETLNRETVRVGGLAAGAYALKIDGEEVGCYTADAFAAGVRLGFNAKTPQYRQAQAVAQRHAELRKRESTMRNHHSARWYFRNKAPVDDVAAFRVWYDEKLKSGQNGPWDGYFGKFIPGYLEYWPKRLQVREELYRDQEAARLMAKPVPHRYEIVRVDG